MHVSLNSLISPHQGESVDDGIVCLYKEADQVVIAVLCR